MVADFAALNNAARDAERQARSAALDSSRYWISPDGARLSDRVWRARQSTRRLIDNALRQAIANGTGALVVANQLEQYLQPEYRPVRRADGTLASNQPRRVVTFHPTSPLTPHKGSAPARRLARTEVSRAHAQASLYSAARNPFVTGMRWVRANAANEPDECDGYANHDEGMGRGVYPIGKFPRMPAHPQCFPAGTLVSGPPAVASTVRWYAGELVEIVTASGNLLAVTPNHPVLTAQGWVAAGLLNEGDHVVSRAFRQGGATGINPDDDDVPALIEDVAVSLGGSLLVATVSVPTAPEDFHGDGIGSDVCVVRTNGQLGSSDNAPVGKPSLQQQFSGRRSEPPFLPGQRVAAFGFEALGLPPDGLMRRRRLRLTPFGSKLGHLQPISVGLAAAGNPSQAEAARDSAAGRAKPFRQLLLGHSVKVEAGDFVGVQVTVGVSGMRALCVSQEIPFTGRAPKIAGNKFLGQSLLARVPPMRARRDAISGNVVTDSVLNVDGGCLSTGNRLGQSDPSGFLRAAKEAALDEFDPNEPTARVPTDCGAVKRTAREVVFDRVLNVFRRSFSGHVYNLQTTEGWLFSNGIITHNCRCHCQQVTRTDTDNVVSELRAAYQLDQDWTAGLSASDRLAFHVRADAMRRGLVELFEAFFKAAGVTG